MPSSLRSADDALTLSLHVGAALAATLAVGYAAQRIARGSSKAFGAPSSLTAFMPVPILGAILGVGNGKAKKQGAMVSTSSAIEDVKAMKEADVPTTICLVMQKLYTLGWCSGSGGGISIRDKEAGITYTAPSGVQKEMISPDEIFSLDPKGAVLKAPSKPGLKVSECAQLFQQAFELRDAGAALHSHAMDAVMVTKMCGQEFRISGLEMLKGIPGHGNLDEAVVPIIENTESECELVERLRFAIIAYPRTYAVLVRGHGMYVWGPTWQKAKTIAECYHYLCEAYVRMVQLELITPTPATRSVLTGPRAWYMEDVEAGPAQKQACRLLPETPVPQEVLDKLGVFYVKLDGTDADPKLAAVKKEYGYDFADVVTVSPAGLGAKYEPLTKMFFGEHFHSDDEVRYVMKGSGYFDVRDKDGRWIRIQCLAGDLINLPAGMYHRFTTDENDYIVAMRLFAGEPVWTAIPPDEKAPERIAYVKDQAQRWATAVAAQ